MRLPQTIVITLALAMLGAGCEQSEVGRRCVTELPCTDDGKCEALGLVCGADKVCTMDIANPGGASTEGDVQRSEGSEVVEYNVNFPCNDIICVATMGRGSYCSQECNEDSQCPDAFECREIMDYGPFIGRSFCSWKRCEQDTECGDPWELGCLQVEELSLGTDEVTLCGWRE